MKTENVESKVNRVASVDLTAPKVERHTVTDFFIRGSNFAVCTREGNLRATVLTTGLDKLLFDTDRLPELAAALLAFHRAATGKEAT